MSAALLASAYAGDTLRRSSPTSVDLDWPDASEHAPVLESPAAATRNEPDQRAAGDNDLSPAAPAPLLPRVAEGHREAVAECLDRYGPLAWSIARRMLGPGQDAEDAVQDAFIDLWRNADRFDPARSNETTFVAMVVRRRTVDRLRRRTSGSRGMQIDAAFEPDALPGAGRGSEPADRLEADEEAAAALAALDDLPPPRGELVKLAVCDGLTHGQLAERFNLPLGTVKSHVRRGLQAVRDTLQRGATP